MHHADRLDLMLAVLVQALLHGLGIGAGAPVPGHEVDIKPQAFGQVPPQDGELAGLEHQDLVAGR